MPLYETIKVDRGKLVELIKATVNRKRYRLGAKIAPLSLDAQDWGEVDCSGYLRWLIYQISGVKIPDGSWHQHQWCIETRLKPTDYENCALTDDRIRIAFIGARPRSPGHVWLVVNGWTIESYGGHGPGRRHWWVKALAPRVTSTFVLTEPMSMT